MPLHPERPSRACPESTKPLFRKSKSIVGLDIGSQTLKAVEITLEGAEAVVTAFSRVEIDGNTDRSKALNELVSNARFHTKQAASAVSGSSVIVRYISMVPMSDSELRQAIQFESDKYLPFDLDEMVLDCQRLDHAPADSQGGDKQMSVVLVACQKGMVSKVVDEIQGMGFQPAALDVDVFALGNAYELTHGIALDPSTTGDGASALIDVGASRTQINVIRAGETCFSREIGLGGNDMTKAIARRLSLDLAEAEVLKRDPGEREIEVTRAITPILEDLCTEINMSLDFVEGREAVRVEELLLSGGGALAMGAIEFFEQQTGRPARTWNPLQGLTVDPERVDVDELEALAPTLAIAVGLAARVKAA